MSVLMILTWSVPLAAAALAPFSRFWWLPAIAAVPALATAVLVPVGSVMEIPWLLLGTVLGMNDTDRVFLAFTSVLWLAAGIYTAGSMRAGPQAGRFRSFFLLAMAGNLWLIVGLDLVSFYTGFSLMGIASYGLVVHEGDRPALRAGKVYLVMTLLGELALLVALVLIANHAGGLVPTRNELIGLADLTVGLLILGLAIKAGLVPVHVWLPLAHPAAPVPASAVLSGAMIKVALLGWLRFLPVGDVALIEWGVLMLIIGLLTLFYALPIGLVQSNPKVILAYSSVSKMGLMAMILGLILLEPNLASAGVLALSLYAAHHGLVKGGLFLGVGMRHYARAQTLVLAGVALLALSLAGVPPSGGAVAKYQIKPTLAGSDWSWITAAVGLSTVGTALLMARFMWVIWRTEPHPSQGQILGGSGWAGLVLLSLLFPLLLGDPVARATNALPIGIALAVAIPIALVAWRKPGLLRPAVDRVPAGDLLGLVRPLLAVIGFASRALGLWWSRLLRVGATLLDTAVAALGPAPEDPERRLRRWPNVGTAWLVVIAVPLSLSLWTLADPGAWDQPRVDGRVPAVMPSHAEPAVSLSDADARPPRSNQRTAEKPTPEDAPPENRTTSEPILEAPLLDSLPPGLPAPGEPVLTMSPQIVDSEVPLKTPSAPLASDAPKPKASTEKETAPQGLAAKDTELQGDSAHTAPAKAVASASQETPGIRAGDYACDPERPFVFDHPTVAQPLRLKDCVHSPEGPRRLVAPLLTNPLVDLVQRHLNDLGYNSGPADGLIGPRTRGAVRRFQLDHGEKPTGTITFALLERILAAAARKTNSAGASAK